MEIVVNFVREGTILDFDLFMRILNSRSDNLGFMSTIEVMMSIRCYLL